jgi:hypothetical protein
MTNTFFCYFYFSPSVQVVEAFAMNEHKAMHLEISHSRYVVHLVAVSRLAVAQRNKPAWRSSI